MERTLKSQNVPMAAVAAMIIPAPMDSTVAPVVVTILAHASCVSRWAPHMNPNTPCVSSAQDWVQAHIKAALQPQDPEDRYISWNE